MTDDADLVARLRRFFARLPFADQENRCVKDAAARIEALAASRREEELLEDARLGAALARADALVGRVDRLVEIIGLCAAALPNGAHIGEECSDDFRRKLPGEISSFCNRIAAERDAQKERAEYAWKNYDQREEYLSNLNAANSELRRERDRLTKELAEAREKLRLTQEVSNEIADALTKANAELAEAKRKIEYEINWRKTALGVARADERERCARIAESILNDKTTNHGGYIAAAIRRG